MEHQNLASTIRDILRFFVFIISAILSYLIPKSSKKTVFICNETGALTGNIKALYQYALNASPELRLLVFTGNENTYHSLKNRGYDVFFYPCLLSIWHLLTSRKVVIETGLSIERCGFCLNSQVFQLWHGANLKYMVKEWDALRDRSGERFLVKTLRNIKVNLPRYEFVLAPSEFYKENTFKTSFNAKNVYVAGYPRNDIFFKTEKILDLESADAVLIDKAKAHRNNGGTVILYCPTWRDQASRLEGVSPFDEAKLFSFLEKNNILLIMKKHHRDLRVLAQAKHILIDIYPHSLDIYPLMKHTNMLISDYSSIFFDYLLLNKPVIFYPYDYEQYMRRDRLFQYDYNEFTPGRKCRSEESLYTEIILALKDKNYYVEERDKVKGIVFDQEKCRDSSSYIWNEILKA